MKSPSPTPLSDHLHNTVAFLAHNLEIHSAKQRGHSNSMACDFAIHSAFRQPETLRTRVADVGVNGINGSQGVFAQCGLGAGDVFG